MKVPSPVYGAVPSAAVTVTDVFPPKHAMAVPCDDDAAKAVGSVMVTLVEEVHPLASATVKV